MSELDQLYQQIILDHSRQRHGASLSAEAAAQSSYPARTGQCHQLNPTCGDEITVRLSVDESGQTFSGFQWAGEGCSISMASASMLTDLVGESTVPEVHALIDQFREMLRSRGKIEGDPELFGDAAALSGVSKFTARIKCAMLAWVAAEDALRQAEA